MTVDMHYRIASVSKMFTAHAVLELAGQGKLSLDDPLARFVPDIPHGEAITVRDLLGLRGGVYDFATDPVLLAPYQADPTLPGWSPDDALQIIRAHPDKALAPRTGTVYSNSEYILLGYVIERASGQPGAGLPRRPDRAHRSTGHILPHRHRTADTLLARLHRHGRTLLRRRSAARHHRLQSAGALDGRRAGVHGPGHDPLRTAGGRWGRAASRAAAQRQTWTRMSAEAVPLQYGLGVQKVGDWVGHDGTMLGYSNMVFHRPATGTTVVVMVNAVSISSAPAAALWLEVVQLLYPDSLPP